MGSDAAAVTLYDSYDTTSIAVNQADYIDAAANSALFVDVPSSVTPTYATTGSPYSVYPYWMRVVGNQFTNNFASQNHAILDVRGVPRVHMEDNSFTENGDMISEVHNEITTPVVSAGTLEQTLKVALNAAVDPSNLSKGLVYISQALDVYFGGQSADGNWFIETSYTEDRA